MMRKSSGKLSNPLWKVFFLALAIMMPGAGHIFAAQLPFPIPPIFVPPPPPCISTGAIFEFPGGCYACTVRNASTDNYGQTGITVELRNEFNQVQYTSTLTPLSPGETTIAEFCSTPGFTTISCVVTTGVGTVGALRDFAVVEQWAPGVAEGNKISTNPATAQTEGKIFNSCQPASPSPTNAP